MDLKVEYIPIEDIKPYENNAKLHPAFQIEQIKKSIQEFGFADPLALWHGEVVEGHGRLLAAQKLGMKVIPCIKLDTLTDEQRRAYGLIHNKLTMNSDFDIDLLAEELDSIGDIDMGDFGFSLDDDENTPADPPEAKINDEYCLQVECETEADLEALYNRLQGEGYKCRVSTL
jgi:ParB-like chromosome segregation protein Spo0J